MGAKVQKVKHIGWKRKSGGLGSERVREGVEQIANAAWDGERRIGKRGVDG